MGKTHRFDKDDDRNLLVEELDGSAADLMRLELEAAYGIPEPGTKYYAITDHLGAELDAIDSTTQQPQAAADAERQAIYNAAVALGALVDAEYGADDVS